MTNKIFTLLALSTLTTLTAAGCSKDSSSSSTSGPADKPTKGDWSRVAFESHTITRDGVAFTIDVPKGLPRDSRDPARWDNAKPEFDHVPKVSARLAVDPEITLAKAVASDNTDASAEFVRKEDRPSGFAYTKIASDRHYIYATTMTRTGGKLIECTASQVNEGPLSNPDGTRAMLEKICDSVKPST